MVTSLCVARQLLTGFPSNRIHYLSTRQKETSLKSSLLSPHFFISLSFFKPIRSSLATTAMPLRSVFEDSQDSVKITGRRQKRWALNSSSDKRRFRGSKCSRSRRASSCLPSYSFPLPLLSFFHSEERHLAPPPPSGGDRSFEKEDNEICGWLRAMGHNRLVVH